MIKQIWIVQCDICGKIENAKEESWRGETNGTLPTGWKYGYNKKIHICPECYQKCYYN